jgi:hypothetical protein
VANPAIRQLFPEALNIQGPFVTIGFFNLLDLH